MVIDKTTGRGCALCISSKRIIGQLIAEGIVDQAICRRPGKGGCDVLTVVEYGKRLHVWPRRGGGPEAAPLWTPSFIDGRIWERAVSRFRPGKLDQNVEEHLLPEMDAYLEGLSDPELISLTRDFLIARGVIHAPIAQRAGKTYYFNSDEIYSLDKKSVQFPYHGRIKRGLFDAEHESCLNLTVWKKAVSQFELGMTLTECIGVFLKTELKHDVPQEPSPLDRLVQYIAPPAFERVSERSSEAGFDYIRITVGLPRYRLDSWAALRDAVKTHQRGIYKRVVQRLANDRQFKKYGIPLSRLRLRHVMLLRDFSMDFIFELKAEHSVEARCDNIRK